MQNLQETLFTEKQTIIENCLFGVDINPKSVMICQLRLWVELLKNAYYIRPVTSSAVEMLQLQTLPNIDINIKTGNSLISKFAIKDNVFERIAGFQKKLQEYKNWVHIYKNTNDKKAKAVLKENVQRFKDEFKLADLRVTKLQNELRKLNGVYYDKYQTHQFFAKELTEKELFWKQKLETEINDKQVEIQSLKDNPIYKDAFEWRFEFPEVLDDKGNFIGFDVVIGNPPYIKEYEGKHIFDGLRENEVYQGKMDIWYMFTSDGIKLLKDNGLLNFIAPNNWTTNSGASKMRNFVLSKSKIESLVDFGSYMVFDTASIQTMIMTFKKEVTEKYSFDYRKIQTNKPSYENAIQLLNKVENENCIYLEQNIVSKNALNQLLTFTTSTNDIILDKILAKKNFNLDEKNEIAQGIVPNPDVLSRKSYSNYYTDNPNYTVGEPVFILPKNYIKNLSEIEINFLKPLYEPTDLERFFIYKSFSKEIIYLTKKNEVKGLNNLINHLEKFKDVLGERRETQSGQIKFYHIHWAREEKFFKKTEKILIPRKTLRPVFSYTSEESYVMMSCNVIISNRINLKYLTGLLNTKLIEFWLRNKGKMQGNNFQLDKEPLLNIPVFLTNNQQPIINLVDQILTLKKANPQADTNDLEKRIDAMVYQLYELTPEEIEVVENS